MMSPELFAILTLLLNLVLSVTVVFRKYHRKTTIPLLGIGVLLPVANFLGLQFFNTAVQVENYHLLIKLYYGLSVVAVVFLSYIACTFLRSDNLLLFFKGRITVNVNLFYSVILIAGLLLVSLLPIDTMRNRDIVPFNSMLFDLLLFLILVLHIFSLYSLEKTWHYAHEYQRRITRLFFILGGIR